MKNQSVCIIGIGNILRADDGVGAFIVQAIENKKFKNVYCFTEQQLQIELLEEACKYSFVIIIDAAVQEKSVVFKKLNNIEIAFQPVSHYVNAEMFAALAKQLYQNKTEFYYCGIKGKNFELGEQISSEILQLANEAVDIITGFIVDLNKYN